MLIDCCKRIVYVQKLVLNVLVLDLKLVLASISILILNQTSHNTYAFRSSTKSLKISVLRLKSHLHPLGPPIIWMISVYLFIFTSMNHSHNRAGTVFLVSISGSRRSAVPLNLLSCMA